MNPGLAIRRLLAILMIAGLALAPVSRPAMAAASSSPASEHAMMDGMTMSGMASSDMTSSEISADTTEATAGEMPCCPSKAPMPVDCDKCVFMASCGPVFFAGAVAAISHPFPILSDAIALHRNDARPDGLGHPPPEHPPRRLV